jgi:phage shock protein PspC (stress-responsive transcriptional regulator)
MPEEVIRILAMIAAVVGVGLVAYLLGTFVLRFF